MPRIFFQLLLSEYSQFLQGSVLLAMTDHPIGEITGMVGFTIRSEFGKAILKRFNMTPSAYRTNCANKDPGPVPQLGYLSPGSRFPQPLSITKSQKNRRGIPLASVDRIPVFLKAVSILQWGLVVQFATEEILSGFFLSLPRKFTLFVCESSSRQFANS